jgi:hypothetical protein
MIKKKKSINSPSTTSFGILKNPYCNPTIRYVNGNTIATDSANKPRQKQTIAKTNAPTTSQK